MKYQKIEKETFAAIQIQKETINDALLFVGDVSLSEKELVDLTNSIEFKGVYVQTVRGPEKASIGDYIIKEDNSYSVMSGPFFESLYEKVSE
ncbi:hypothetical protein [Carnobacterium antarcticum]|uniref:Uncharacterized protein n=1 Tax=Carnobacterium antarcticum TaxID=2126436 RepID=A0ABW4NQA4_9LACT|nr:hypothetical protein [Carnobacterium sp. CP1]ALV20745.1 hypothetical protein NY10_120 [Carnobacterium sp. CP1]